MVDQVEYPYLVAVTGTNGKTSITSFVAQIANACGIRAAAVGQRIELPGGVLPRTVVPRGRGALAGYFHELAHDGIELVACEAYSAAIARGAHSGIRYDCVAFNNLAADHEPVHGSHQRYREAKLSLLDGLAEGTPLVMPKSAVGAYRIARRAKESGMVLHVPRDGTGPLSDIGFMAENLSVAMEVCRLAGLDSKAVQMAAEAVRLPPGRMVLRKTATGASVVVDFAHNAHGLTAVLSHLRARTEGRVHLVFGSKGGWGAAKRRKMGNIAARWASRVIVTDDDPRREDPALIRRQIRGAHPFEVIPDRGLAIATALSALRRGDVLLIAGRGEDPFFVEAFGRRPFNDLAVVERWILLHSPTTSPCAPPPAPTPAR